MTIPHRYGLAHRSCHLHVLLDLATERALRGMAERDKVGLGEFTARLISAEAIRRANA